MTQNILALIIVFSAALITVYSVIRSITSKKASHCSGCSACKTKKDSTVHIHSKHPVQKINFQQMKMAPMNLK